MDLVENSYLFHRKNHTVVGRILSVDGQYANVEWYDPTWRTTSEDKIYVQDYLKHLRIVDKNDVVNDVVYALASDKGIKVSHDNVTVKGVTSTHRGFLFNVSVITERCIFDGTDLAERGYSVSTVYPDDFEKSVSREDFLEMVSMAKTRLERKGQILPEELASMYYGEFPFKHKHLSELNKMALAALAIEKVKV
nr:hypothetical protein BdHM001_35930 [Bdellovibrio sp. HM001]